MEYHLHGERHQHLPKIRVDQNENHRRSTAFDLSPAHGANFCFLNLASLPVEYRGATLPNVAVLFLNSWGDVNYGNVGERGKQYHEQ